KNWGMEICVGACWRSIERARSLARRPAVICDWLPRSSLRVTTYKKEKVMFRVSLSWMLAASLVFALLCAPNGFATTSKEEKEAQWTEKVKAGIAQLGVGKEARVKVKLRDGEKLSGYC